MIRRLSRLAGLTRECRFHGLRHEGITAALNATNGDVRTVRMFSGHAKLETLLRYDDQRAMKPGPSPVGGSRQLDSSAMTSEAAGACHAETVKWAVFRDKRWSV